MSQRLLEAHSLVKRYAGVTVLDGVSFDLREGEVHALLGANGAGKSTLCRILAGLVQRTAGEIKFLGSPYRPRTNRDAQRMGVQMVQQELNLVPSLSVAENLLLNRLPNSCGLIRYRQLHRIADSLLERLGIDGLDPRSPLSELGIGQQQLIEIAAALHQNCRLLILDEPTASLSARESERLFDWLDQLKRQGVGTIYVTHRLDEVARLADRFTVLRDGRWIATRPADGVQAAEMIELMSGPDGTATSIEESTGRSPCLSPGKIEKNLGCALRVRNLSSGPVRNVSFEVACGERVGIAGLVGAGRTELLRAIFGAQRASTGEIFIGQDPAAYRFTHPSQAVSRGMAMLTEDRKSSGLLMPMTIATNTSLASLAMRFASFGFVRGRVEARESQRMCDYLDTRCHSVHQTVQTLSGGNQQKVAVAKWLVRDCQVFLMDEPTRGIDQAARRRLYRLIDSLARRGCGLVIVSSEVEELMRICDRILVLSVGELVAEFRSDQWSREKIMQACFINHRQKKEVQNV
jgi:ribose transport system ATP-binding protein